MATVIDDIAARELPLRSRVYVSAKALARELLRTIQALAIPRRGAARVEAEYDGTYWKSAVEARPWERFASLEEYLTGDDERPRIARVEHRLCRISTRRYYRYRIQVVQQLLREFASDVDELVELGCGTGRNLFSLALDDRWRRLRGYEISPNGIEACRAIADHFGVRHVDVGHIDLTDGRSRGFDEIAGAVVFTYHCLEQLKYSTRQVIENLLAAGCRRVIHIEPVVETLRVTSLSDLACYLRIKSFDYQDRLLQTLRRLERAGRLSIRAVRRLGHSPTPHYGSALICWEPRSTGA